MIRKQPGNKHFEFTCGFTIASKHMFLQSMKDCKRSRTQLKKNTMTQLRLTTEAQKSQGAVTFRKTREWMRQHMRHSPKCPNGVWACHQPDDRRGGGGGQHEVFHVLTGENKQAMKVHTMHAPSRKMWWHNCKFMKKQMLRDKKAVPVKDWCNHADYVMQAQARLLDK